VSEQDEIQVPDDEPRSRHLSLMRLNLPIGDIVCKMGTGRREFIAPADLLLARIIWSVLSFPGVKQNQLTNLFDLKITTDRGSCGS
jgi:hypothetical protein